MEKRTYRQSARADAAEQTGARIVGAMLDRYRRLPYDQIRLVDVAADAEVTEQTVIRRFGSKAGLMVATVQRELGRIVESRALADTGAPSAVVAELVRHYESYGTLILKVYADAGVVDELAPVAAAGRAHHLEWCRQTFAARLDDRGSSTVRDRRMAQVIAICDATTWRILREDAGLTARQATTALLELISPLLRDDRPHGSSLGGEHPDR